MTAIQDAEFVDVKTEIDESDLPPNQYLRHGEIRYRKPDDFEPENLFPDPWPDDPRKSGNRRCQAWSRTKGCQCAMSPSPSMDVCRFHGGHSAMGPAASGYRHGMHSKLLPHDVRRKYEEVMNDPRLANLNENLAIITLELQKELGEHFSEESMYDPEMLKICWKRLKKSILKDEPEDVAKAMDALEDVLESADAHIVRWNRISNILEQHRQTVATKTKIELDASKSYSAAELMTLLDFWISALGRHVKDRSILDAFIRDVRPTLIGERSESAG